MNQHMTKPHLAAALPDPRSLSDAQMEQATREARQLLAEFDRATAGMETLKGSDERIRLK